MENFLHPITWGIVFTIGLIFSLKYFLNNGNIFRKILITLIILFMIFLIDLKVTHFFAGSYIINVILLPLLLMGIFITMYIEDYYTYKKSSKTDADKRDFIKNTFQYLFVISFLVIVYWIF